MTARNEPVIWVVDLEQDPDTGDLIMPLPQALLENLGWHIGDTLVWNVDSDSGEVTLARAPHDNADQ